MLDQEIALIERIITRTNNKEIQWNLHTPGRSFVAETEVSGFQYFVYICDLERLELYNREDKHVLTFKIDKQLAYRLDDVIQKERVTRADLLLKVLFI